MKELALQQLLRTQGLPALEPLAIKARRHPQYPELICLKYDQRLSPMSEAAVQDARGIILNENDNWNVVSMAYRKFFNLEEGHAAEIDWPTARVEEKLDGSLLCLYWHDSAWQVASSGTADAGGVVIRNIREKYDNFTYAELFWQTWRELGYALPPSPEELGAPYTFAFELMTPLNQVVVHHERPRLVLHGVRNLSTLKEERAEDWGQRFGYETVKTYPLSRDGLRAAANAITPMQGEGFVVRDAQFQRIKVKSEQYVQVSLIRESWNEKRALELIMLGEQDEFLSYFPEYRPQLEALQTQLAQFYQAIDAAYAEIHSISDQKEFALRATKSPNSAAFFQLRQGKASTASQWFASLTPAARLRALEAAGIVLN